MSNLIFSLNATIPIFTIILLGWFLKKIKVINDTFVSSNNFLTFNILFPVLLFRDISKMDIRAQFDISFLLTCFLLTIAAILIITAVALIFIKDRSMVGSFIQGSFRGSAAILGIPIAENLYGNSGMVPMMIIAAVPVYNISSVIILTVFSEDRVNKKINFRQLLLDIVKNPMIIGITAGLPFALAGITLPQILTKSINSLSSIVTPLALLMVGAGFDAGVSLKQKLRPSLAASLIKLVIQPALLLPIPIMMGFRNQELIAIFIMLASPATVSGYIMARSMKNDAQLASGIVVITTIFAAVTVTAFIYIFKLFAWI
ncbi:MAG: AEC family transporter [Oscillospiraceae bacterium]|nr:AEC family transporter [Oscillospiraceae bacterium]